MPPTAPQLPVLSVIRFNFENNIIAMDIRYICTQSLLNVCMWLDRLKMLFLSKIYSVLYVIYGVYVLLFCLEFVYKECCNDIVGVIFFSLLPLKVILMGLVSAGLLILCKFSYMVESYDEEVRLYEYSDLQGARSTIFGYIVRTLLYLSIFTHTALNTFCENQDALASFGRLILLIILLNVFYLLLVTEKTKCRFIVSDVEFLYMLPVRYIPIFRPWPFSRLLYILCYFIYRKKSIFRCLLLILMFIFSYVFVAAVIFALFMIFPISWEQFSSLFTRLPFLG